jgi:hypothetical protein
MREAVLAQHPGLLGATAAAPEVSVQLRIDANSDRGACPALQTSLE